MRSFVVPLCMRIHHQLHRWRLVHTGVYVFILNIGDQCTLSFPLKRMHAINTKTTHITLHVGHVGNKKTIWWPQSILQRCSQWFVMASLWWHVAELISFVIQTIAREVKHPWGTLVKDSANNLRLSNITVILAVCCTVFSEINMQSTNSVFSAASPSEKYFIHTCNAWNQSATKFCFLKIFHTVVVLTKVS